MATTKDVPKPEAQPITYMSLLLKADPSWFQSYAKVPEAEFSNGRKFEHYWMTRGPYST